MTPRVARLDPKQGSTRNKLGPERQLCIAGGVTAKGARSVESNCLLRACRSGTTLLIGGTVGWAIVPDAHPVASVSS